MPISLQGAEEKEEVVEELARGQQKGCRAEHFKRRRLRKPLTAIHLPEAFAKTKKATNILRPAIDVSF